MCMKIHSCRRKYVLEYVLALLCVGVFVYSNNYLFLPLSGACLSYAEYMRYKMHILFDESKISVVDGIIARKVHAIYFDTISDITVHQTIWQRMLGYGSIILRSNSGTENLIFPAVRTPYKVVEHLEQRIESNKRKEVLL